MFIKQTARLNLALIGCGRIAQSHLQAIAQNPQCRLVAAVDVCEEAARAVAAQHGCRAFIDYQELLDAKLALDAVIICTPPRTYAEIALQFLDRGIHVLCEKPLAVSSNHARLMVKKAEEKGCLLMMASKFRYVADVIKAKAMLEAGVLGEVILFENVFCSKVDMTQRWNAQRALSGGGVLIDNGCHSVDIARYLLGPIVKVQAEEGKRVQPLEVEDTSRLYFRAANDALGAVDLSWSIHKERDAYIEIFGTKGVISIGWKGSKFRRSEKSEWEKFGEGYDKNRAFDGQLENFIAALKGREQPLITGVDGLESVKVIEAAYQSAKINKWVEVEPIAVTHAPSAIARMAA